MDSLQPVSRISLQYLNTREHILPARSSKEISSGEQHLFGFVMKGSLDVTLQKGDSGRSGKVSFGEVFLLPDDCLCTLRNHDKQPAQLILIRFKCSEESGSAPSRVTASLVRKEELQLYSFRMPQVRNWIDDMLNDGKHREPFRHFLIQSHLYAIAAEFMTYMEKPKTEDDLIDYVVQVRQNMLEHYDTAMDIEEIARLSGSSPARFYQAFKRYTGLSPLQFMTIARLNESLGLLAGQSTSIMEVAHSIGYADELYFSRLFKKHMGIAPKEYAARARIRIANLCPVFNGDLKALGVTPVLSFPRSWFEDEDKDKYVRQVELAGPDIIFTSPLPKPLYRRFEQIAPTVMIQWKGYPWKERLQEIGAILGMPTVAGRWLSYFHRKVDNARLLIRRYLNGEPFLLVSVHDTFFRVYGMQRIKMQDLFYDELQMTPPASVYPVSFLDVTGLKQIGELQCGNVLFLVPASLSGDSCSRLEEEWLELNRNRPSKRCILLRHEEPLLYNASFYDSLVDQLVNDLLLNRDLRNIHAENRNVHSSRGLIM